MKLFLPLFLLGFFSVIGCSAQCGDGAVEADEECDDGNTTNADGCEADCSLPFCGNAILDANEACDDGNNINGDGCDSSCTPTGCGNGVVSSSEECDDSNTINGDGCSSGCIVEVCGDGVINNAGLEECDDGNSTNNDGCSSSCVLEVCGDGAINSPTEVCDDGDLLDGDGCDSNCTPTGCGNGALSSGEACDDGNTTNGDGCNSSCVLESCGDGVVNNSLPGSPGEECDDANAIEGDGCDSNCTTTRCGNGILTAGELCFRAPTVKAPSSGINSVATGDVNSDGKTDLIIAAQNDNTIELHTGNGDGTFQFLSSFSADLEDIQALDFDGDGIVDIVGVNQASDQIRFLKGSGAATFTAMPSFSAVVGLGFRIENLNFIDINADSVLDLIFAKASVVGAPGTLQVGIGSGGFSFQPQQTIQNVAFDFKQIVFADINADGLLDIVAGGLPSPLSSDELKIFIGDGASFLPASTLPLNSELVGVSVLDLDQDGDNDIVASHNNFAAFSTVAFLNDGAGTFNTIINNTATHTNLADMNLDGIPDLISNGVTVRLGDGLGGFLPANSSDRLDFSASFVIQSDFNNDGIPDFAAINRTFKDIAITLGDGVGLEYINFMADNLQGDLQELADMDQDGDLDVLILALSGGHIFFQDNPLQYQAPPLEVDSIRIIGNVIPSDLNQDGFLDLLFLNRFAEFRPEGAHIALADGAGGFLPPSPALFTPPRFSDDAPAVLVDLNNDGALDLLALANSFPSALVSALGNADGTFQNPTEIPIPDGGSSLAAADFNGDSFLDAVYSVASTDQLIVFFGAGDGTLFGPFDGTTGDQPNKVLAVDISEDGIPDLISADFNSNTVSIHFGVGDGAFLARIALPVGTKPSDLVAADFNADGIVDLATANLNTNGPPHNNDHISLLIGTGAGNFLPQTTFTTGGKVRELLAADLNEDGISDLVLNTNNFNLFQMLSNP